MKLPFVARTFAVVLSCGALLPVPTTAVEPDTAGLSGPELARLLPDPIAGPRAFHELWNRAHPTSHVDIAAFERNHYDPEVVVCPQEDGAPPLYVVLYGFLDRARPSWEPRYEISNPSELFDPGGIRPPPRPWDLPAIAVFTSDGAEIKPFGGNNCLNPPGRMADLNGDGFVERADHSNYGIAGIDHAAALEIVAVAPVLRPLLAVLYNWEDDEWTYRFTDADGDGVFGVELGPKTPRGMRAKIAYAWDPATRSYVGPAGTDGDHFRRLDAAVDPFRELERLKKNGLSFPSDPDFADERLLAGTSWERKGLEPPKPEDLSGPYRKTSLRNLTDAEILRYMGDGKNASELEQAARLTNHSPNAFWTMPPKEAALALVDANRSPLHRDLYALAADDRDGGVPPDVCSVAFTYVSDKSYFDVDEHFFLRADPKRSYLAFAKSENGGLVFFNFIRHRPVYDFRLCELDYVEARHWVHVLWWLDRVRSHRANPPESSGTAWSSADGKGGLVFRDAAGETVFRREGTLWCDHAAERWTDDYSPEVFLNIASFLFVSAFPDRLGERWSGLAPRPEVRSCGFDASACSPPETGAFPEQTAAFLDLFVPDQTALSLAIAREAVRAAGHFADASLEPRLAKILDSLPVPAPKRSRKDLQAEIDRLRSIPPSDPGWPDAQDRQSALHDELMAGYRDTGADDVQSLRDAITLSLRMIRSANELDALQAWACTRDPGAAWALQRLRDLDRPRYVAALEWWVSNSSKNWARQAFDAIACEDAPRASEIARNIAADSRPDLAVTSFAQLSQANELPDGPQRIAALIRVALATNSHWQERGRAIEWLVPPDQPLKYPGPEIDEALVQLLDPARADAIVNWTLGKACMALARRERADAFDAMADVLVSLEDPLVYDDVLDALVQLAQVDPPRFNPRLRKILRPQLRRTNKRVTSLLMAAWSADLRKLKPDVERIATSGPDDYESERAHCCGGDESPVDDRFHLARQIAALWNEDDPATEARLLLAFGFHRIPDVSGAPSSASAARLDAELRRLARTMTPAQLAQANAFLDGLRPAQPDPESAGQTARAEFVERAGRALRPAAP